MPRSKTDLDRIWGEFSSGETAPLATKLNYADEKELVTAVATQILNEANKLTGALRRHVFDAIVFGSVVLMVLIFIFVSRQSFPHGKSPQVVVISAQGIQRYHVIAPADVVIQIMPTTDNSLGHVEEVLGHYPVEDVRFGAIIRSTQLSAGTIAPAELSGRETLFLPIRSTGLLSKRLPTQVLLYIPQKSNKPTITIDDAYLLSVSASQDAVGIAVTPAEAQVITNSVTGTDAYIAERIR